MGGRGHRSSRCLSPPQGEKVDVDVATPWPSHDTHSMETLEQSQETQLLTVLCITSLDEGLKMASEKPATVDQRLLPPLEETPRSMRSSHAVPRRILSLQMGGSLVGQTALSPYLRSLSNPGVLIVTGGLQLSPCPPASPGLPQGPEQGKEPMSGSQPRPAHQARPPYASKDTQPCVQADPELVTGHFPELTRVKQLCERGPLELADGNGVRAVRNPKTHSCSSSRKPKAPPDVPQTLFWKFRQGRTQPCEPRGRKASKCREKSKQVPGLQQPRGWSRRRGRQQAWQGASLFHTF